MFKCTMMYTCILRLLRCTTIPATWRHLASETPTVMAGLDGLLALLTRFSCGPASENEPRQTKNDRMRRA